ncbi:MAG: alanine dehydrogenase [Ignavibacteriales bacterium]|nr:alanine dehydrogenase [Ignavibacteriales bacterium]
MNIGIVKEVGGSERRVALVPSGVHALVAAGHTVYVERGAGENAHFPDEEYIHAGASINYTVEEVIKRANVVMKILPPGQDMVDMLVPGQTVFSSLHLAVARRKIAEHLINKKVTAIGYELIEDAQGNLPTVQVMSEIGGQLSVQVAGQYLMSREGGRGILLGGVPGIPSANVIILGAGTVGRTAARVAVGYGASVTLLDINLARLREVENLFHWRLTTALATEANIAEAIRRADVVIGAVLLKGQKAPCIVTERMVKSMRPGAVIVDVAIDQGGCVETSRPTSIDDPVYARHGVIHYCVPNMPAIVARTASIGWTNAILPYVLSLAEKGIVDALRADAGFARSVCSFNGRCTNQAVSNMYEFDFTDLQSLLS